MILYDATAIATAAFGVSIFSAGVAFWSAYNSYKSRRAAERTAEITMSKREDELSPKFEAWLEFREGTHFLHLKNTGVVTYDSVVFSLEAADGLVGLPITGLQMSGWGGKYETGDLGQFEAGTTKILIAYVAQLHPSTNFRLRLVCTDSRGRRWTTTTTGDMGRRLIAKKGPNNALD